MAAEIELVADEELRAHNCLESVDFVAGDPEATAFRRRARLQQALWREARDLPIGTQPMRPKAKQPSRLLGSRIELDRARESEANFLDDAVRGAMRDRIGHPEPHQTLDVDRLYCDLLSSMPMCFNLFGALHGDLGLADRAIHRWWPDVRGKLCTVRFEWSPGRLCPGEYLENRSAFDVAFELALNDGRRGVIGVECKYHEGCKREKVPSDERRGRYTKVAEASGIFKPDALSKIWGTGLQQILLDHLLTLSMLQHPSQTWGWAKFVLVHPLENPSYARPASRYQALLKDTATFEVTTIEALLEADVLPHEAALAFRERYLW